MKSTSRRWAALAALAVATTLITATPAFADPDPDAPTASESKEAIRSTAPEVLEDVHEDVEVAGELAQASFDVEDGGTRVVELDATSGEISIEGIESETVTLSLVVSETTPEAPESLITEDGSLYSDHAIGISSTSYIKEGGSVQVLSTIATPEAATRIPFEFSSPSLAKIELVDGIVVLRDADGNMLGGAAPAWAKDAHGLDVPTHYEVDGASLVQVVDHASGKYTYPIVSDPIWGTDLFDSVRPGLNKHILRPSGWGRAIQNGAIGGLYIGEALMRDEGFKEFKARSSIPQFIFPSVKQQYDCHERYASIDWVGGPTWDLEVTRPVVSPDLVRYEVGRHGCNWNYSDGRA